MTDSAPDGRWCAVAEEPKGFWEFSCALPEMRERRETATQMVDRVLNAARSASERCAMQWLAWLDERAREGRIDPEAFSNQRLSDAVAATVRGEEGTIARRIVQPATDPGWEMYMWVLDRGPATTAARSPEVAEFVQSLPRDRDRGAFEAAWQLDLDLAAIGAMRDGRSAWPDGTALVKEQGPVKMAGYVRSSQYAPPLMSHEALEILDELGISGVRPLDLEVLNRQWRPITTHRAVVLEARFGGVTLEHWVAHEHPAVGGSGRYERAAAASGLRAHDAGECLRVKDATVYASPAAAELLRSNPIPGTTLRPLAWSDEVPREVWSPAYRTDESWVDPAAPVPIFTDGIV